MKMQRLWTASAATFAMLAFTTVANAGEISSPVNVRSGPGGKWPVIAVLPAGTDIQVLNCASGWRYAWCSVQVGDVKGWVHAGALGVSRGQVDVAPVVTTDAASLQAAPRIFSAVIATIPAGDTVNVLHCRSGLGSGWCHIAYDGKVGYVRGGLLARNTY